MKQEGFLMNHILKHDDYRVVKKMYGVLSVFSILICFLFAISFGMHEGRWSFSLVFFVISLLIFLAWIGMRGKKVWAKHLSAFLAVVMLPIVFPVSTFVGGYILYYLYRAPTKPRA